MAIINVTNLGKIYGKGDARTVAIDDISFSIEEGEFVAIAGPSGSGKSTLLHILGFLDRPTTGSYQFEGKSISEYSDDECARIRNQKMGFVFQSFNLLSRDTVEENVARPLLYAKMERQERNTVVERALESVGMSHRIYHRPFELSGGEKQRVAIARAIVNDPRVIFADEPTGNLDSQSGTKIMDIFRALHTSGRTIILISHDQEISRHAPRLLSIRDGLLASDKRGGEQ